VRAPDPNRSVVAAQNGSKPDARLSADFDVADQHGIGATNADGAIFGRLPRYSIIMDDASEIAASNLAPMHRHRTPLRGVKATPHPKPDDPNYTAVNYAYAGRTGHIHEVVEIAGRSLAKVGFDDRKIGIIYSTISSSTRAPSGELFTTYLRQMGGSRRKGRRRLRGRTADQPRASRGRAASPT